MENTQNDFARQDDLARGTAADMLASYMPRHDPFSHEIIFALSYLPGGYPWDLSPRGWWDERDGSAVVFDRAHRPIVRVAPDCSRVSIVAPDENISRIKETTYYEYLDAPQINSETRRKIMALSRALAIEEEIARRYHLAARGRLPAGYAGDEQ